MLNRNDKDEGIRRVFGNRLGKVTNGRCSGVEKNVTGHARLSGNTSRDEDDLGTRKGMGNLLLGVPIDFASGVDVADVGGDTRSTSDIIKAQGRDERVCFKEKGERLADTAYIE